MLTSTRVWSTSQYRSSTGSVKLRDEGNSNPPRAGFDVNGFGDHASVKILNSRIDIDEGDTGSVDGNVNLLLFQILG